MLTKQEWNTASSMQKINEEVCLLNGHTIAGISFGSSEIIICLKCGMDLIDIRGAKKNDDVPE